MKQHLILPVALLQILSGTVLAVDGPETISSERIVRAAVEHSAAIGMADQELRAMKAKGRQAIAQGLPSLDIDARVARYEGLEDIVLGSIIIPSIENRYSVTASLLQPVYTGGRLSSLRRCADLQKEAAASSGEGIRADVVFQALAAYWNWAKAFRALDVLESAVRRMTAHAVDIHHMKEAGIVTDNEVLATDVLVERTRLALEQVARQVDHGRAQICFLTGIELATNAEPERITLDGEAGVPPETGLLDTALKSRPERATRGMEVKAAGELAKAARGAFYPHVYLSLRYEQANPNILYIPPIEEWKGDAFAGVTVSWNILDWGLTRARAEEADSRTAQAELRLRLQEERIALDVKEARIALRDALERVELSAKVQKSAQLNLDAATDLWKNGVARHSEVLDAHARLTEAQHESCVAHADLLLARAALAHAVGKTVVPAAGR